MNKDLFLSPENFNKLNQANTDLNKLITLIKNDAMTFDHLCSQDYVKKTVIPYYKSDLNIIRIEKIEPFNTVDIETDKFIVTFFISSGEEGQTSGYKICNDIILSKNAEIEILSGYTDEFEIYPLFYGGYHFIKEGA